MKNYRTAFWLAVCGNILFVLALAVGGWWWYTRVGHSSAQPSAPAAPAAQSSSGPSESSAPAAAESSRPALAPLQLSPQRLQSIGVTTAIVARKPIHDDLRFVGNVAVDERLQAYVQTRFSGWIQQVFVNANYQFVHKGQPLFTIYSPDLVTTEREYLLAKQNAHLLSTSTVSGVAEGAQSLLSATLARLRQWDLPAREIRKLETTGKAEQYLEIDSPVSGFVTERNALPNLYAEPSTRLYTIADLSTVWVFAQVFQNDLGRVRAGDGAQLTVDSYPGRSFYGRVDFIYPDVDMTTRTARVRLVFANPGLRLKPGMFVNVDLHVPMGSQLAIPASAVLQTGTGQVAFIDRGDGYLDPRQITVGPQVADEYIVLKGLKPGERIVTSANFLIDSESQLQAALGSFMPPPPGAGQSASMNQPQATVDFSSVPSPPRKGANSFQVRLTGSDGKPVSGAQVQITFFMPAMPAMGMSAMRAQYSLVDKGGGAYEGQGQLPTGGTWQVTIVARREGKTVASKQLSVNATGGI